MQNSYWAEEEDDGNQYPAPEANDARWILMGKCTKLSHMPQLILFFLFLQVSDFDVASFYPMIL